jgi:hypothetical protein
MGDATFRAFAMAGSPSRGHIPCITPRDGTQEKHAPIKLGG